MLLYIFQTPTKEQFIVPEVRVVGSKSEELNTDTGWHESRPINQSQTGRFSVTLAKGPPPWRDSDRHPTDTIRFNYLENLDPIDHARQA